MNDNFLFKNPHVTQWYENVCVVWCQGMAPRSQSSRDVMRQEAKLQEMSEEVRRRELRLTSPQGRVQVSIQMHCPDHLVLY